MYLPLEDVDAVSGAQSVVTRNGWLRRLDRYRYGVWMSVLMNAVAIQKGDVLQR